MNVIPFPQRSPSPIEAEDPPPPELVEVIAALQSLGEPAMACEIDGLLAHSLDRATRWPDIDEVLNRFSTDGTSRLLGAPVFRSVALGRATGWAFTLEFRQHLRGSGFTPLLRPLE
jgi:hypothetical protein